MQHGRLFSCPRFVGGVLLFLVMGWGVTAKADQGENVSIGSRAIVLPVPRGLAAGPSQGEVWERWSAPLVNPSNRLLHYYPESSEKAEANGEETDQAGRVYYAQTPKGIEEITCSIEQFGEMAHAIAAQFLAEASGGTKSVGSLLAEAKNRPREPVSLGDVSALSMGETRGLGVYERGDHHVSFAIVARPAPSEPASSGEPVATYTAASMCNVGGKVINLYCRVEGVSETVARAAREGLSEWRTAVLAANPAPMSEGDAEVAVSSWRPRLLAGCFASGVAVLCFGIARWRRPQGER